MGAQLPSRGYLAQWWGGGGASDCSPCGTTAHRLVCGPCIPLTPYLPPVLSLACIHLPLLEQNCFVFLFFFKSVIPPNFYLSGILSFRYPIIDPIINSHVCLFMCVCIISSIYVSIDLGLSEFSAKSTILNKSL